MSENIVERKPRPRNRVFVKLSGGRFFTVPESETFPLKKGTVLTDEEIERLVRIDQYMRGREKAVRLLSIRARTRYEIRTALDGMEVPQSLRDGIIKELIEQGLIDDTRFAREFVRARVDVKRLGPHRLRFDLKKLGVAAAIVDDVLHEVFSNESQDEIAHDIVRRKLGGRRPDEKDVRRMGGLLRRKGLDYEVINRVLYDLMQQAGHGEADD